MTPITLMTDDVHGTDDADDTDSDWLLGVHGIIFPNSIFTRDAPRVDPVSRFRCLFAKYTQGHYEGTYSDSPSLSEM